MRYGIKFSITSATKRGRVPSAPYIRPLIPPPKASLQSPEKSIKGIDLELSNVVD
jgi:hypothetical protein